YDANGQLTSVVLPGGRTIAYQYDAAGNLVQVTDSGSTTDYVANELNQYTAVGAATYNYDTDGNLLSKVEASGTTTYSYDVENRLVGVTTPAGTWTYEYDALGNRIASVHNGQRTEFLVDPYGLGNVIGEFDDTGSLIAHYTYGLGLEGRWDGSANSFYDFDAIGSVAGLTSSTGNYLNQYNYLPFGERLSISETVANPFEYIGQWGVMAESNGLDFMQARYYDPENGRFIQPDPLGIDGGDPNFYRYGANNPISLIDPSGEAAVFPPYAPVPPIWITTYIVPAVPWLVAGTVVIAVGYGVYKGYHIIKNSRRDLPKTLKAERWSEEREFAEDFLTNPYGPKQKITSDSTDVRVSKDPNDVVGPAGFGAEGWFIPDEDQHLPYMIRFENAEDAGAPAVFVTVTEQLDADLDWSTFELGDFGFGSLQIDVPDGFQKYETRVDAKESTGGYVVDFAAEFDPTTGQLTYKLTTIDPLTNDLPTDVNAGFLPANNPDTHDGEGFVSYRVQPKASLATGKEITAEASIVFDTNDPIDTPTHKNTVDVTGPTSKVNALPATTNTNQFTLSWTGNDAGSGIASYDIFVSVNSGAFSLLADDTTQTSMSFTGEDGKTYTFYSVATDNVGYVESVPFQADALTRVQIP
ncbi:hypothetical protein IQ225_01400, partial [Synechocystis salina LEGE 06155]|nr:hypothetical protein [Synechocystis salina LEGE 06155]